MLFWARWRKEAVADLSPVGAELDRRDREDEQAEAAVPEDPLDPLERRDPDDDGEPDDREHDQPAVGQAGEQLQGDRDAADLGGERHQVDDLARDERTQGRP